MLKCILIFFFLLFWFVPNSSFAAATCVCYFGEKNDCTPATVSDAALEGECKSACEKAQGGQLKTYEYSNSAIFGGAFIAKCSVAHTIATEKQPKTETVIPKLNVDIPGLTFSPVKKFEGELHVNFLGDYIKGVYKFFIGFAGMAAIVLLIIGGFQWVLGGFSSGQVKKAQDRIKNAVTGLVLLLGVVLILTIINPQLITFEPLRVKFVEEIAVEQKDDEGDVDSTATVKGQLCSSPKSCVKWCQDNPNPGTWPEANDKTIDPKLTKVIPDMPGLKNPRKSRATDDMIVALKKAGAIAVSKNPNYFIRIQDGFRPLKNQIKIVCNKVQSGDQKSINEIGIIVAYPGGSNHGSGMAVDITFYEGGKQLVTSSNKAQGGQQYKDGAELLADIMAQAGMVRYAREIWHFELEGKTKTFCRCKGAAQCPFPASCKF